MEPPKSYKQQIPSKTKKSSYKQTIKQTTKKSSKQTTKQTTKKTAKKKDIEHVRDVDFEVLM